MSYAPEESELSVVEEIDPEPSQKGGWYNPAREALLGLLLILALVAWAVWQWVDGEVKANSYHAGEQAVTAQDWDRAKEQFSNASGYKDADTRAQSAVKLIDERDRHYKSVEEHSALKEWIAALSEAVEVQKVEPHFSDTDHLEEQARQNAYADALSGVIALRPNATPPGLYYRGSTGWLWLEGSDEYSRVLGSGIEGEAVYDASPTPTAPAAQSQTQDQGRRIILATLPQEGAAAKATFTELDYNTNDYDAFNWQSDGVWAFKYGIIRPAGSRQPVGGARDDLVAMAYQPTGSKVAIPVKLPDPAQNRILVDIDYVHTSLLIAEWTNADATGPIVNLYLDERLGATHRLIYTHYGNLISARISPDGTYLLLTAITYETAEDLAIDEGRVEVVLVGLYGDKTIKLLAQRSAIKGASQSSDASPLSSAIISKGPFSNRILLAWHGDQDATLQIINPQDLIAMPLEVTAATPEHVEWAQWTGIQDSTGLVFAVQTFSQPYSGNTPLGGQASKTVTLVSFQLEKEPLVATATIESPGIINLVETHAGNLIYSLSPRNDIVSGLFEVDSVPLSALESTSSQTKAVQPQPHQIYSAPYYQAGTALNFGPRALAYSDGQDLYARSYDGSSTAKLESGNYIDALYSSAFLGDDYIWLH